LPAADAGRLLQHMVEAGELVAGEGGYAPAGAGVLGDDQAVLAEMLLERLAADPFAPPTLAVLAEAVGRPSRELGRILDVLARRGDVARVDKDLWFASGAVDDARAALLTQLEGAGEVTIAGFRDTLGCGRRNAQALLEHFDREGLTLRRGDVRVARRRRS
jgi:selenocysteine-specific elongation factor